MATCDASSDVSLGYGLESGLRLNTDVSTKSSPVEASPLDGYENAPICVFAGIPDLQRRVKLQLDALRDGRTTDQYLIFLRVTKDHLAQIDHQRAQIGKDTRITHYTDTHELIIKVIPLKLHETAHISLGDRVNRKLEGMGLPIGCLMPLGAGRCSAANFSKEGDSSYKPLWCRSGEDDWPTIVIEAGLSESLHYLRADARRWLTKSGDRVKIVILIKIIRERKSLSIEQWCMSPSTRPRPPTRAPPNGNIPYPVLTQISDLTVNQNPPIPPLPGTTPTYTVTGAPLILDFEKLLLRTPVPPEGNVIFTTADLQAWAQYLWSGFK
jgi:hypothetical protein